MWIIPTAVGQAVSAGTTDAGLLKRTGRLSASGRTAVTGLHPDHWKLAHLCTLYSTPVKFIASCG